MEDILRKLVAFPTVTGDSQAAHELIDYVAGFVAQRGMHVERYIANGYESIVATTQPHDKTPTVMLAAHADVVAAPDELFAMRRDGDTIYGRGVLDMKGALAAYLQIIDDLGKELSNYSLGLMVTMDEEIGGHDTMPMLMAEGYRPKVCILPDGGDNWQVQTASKGILVYDITAHGTSSHSSRHWEGDNALLKLLPVIPELQALCPDQGPATNTISINRIKAGKALTQVPNKASLTVDIRSLDDREHVRLQNEVHALCQRHNLEYKLVAEGDPTHFDLTDPMIAPYVSLIEQTVGVAVHGTLTLGSNDARFMAPFGISCISYYPDGAGLHTAEEWVSATALDQMYRITKQYVQAMASLPTGTAPTAQPARRNFSRMQLRRLLPARRPNTR